MEYTPSLIKLSLLIQILIEGVWSIHPEPSNEKLFPLPIFVCIACLFFHTRNF